MLGYSLLSYPIEELAQRVHLSLRLIRQAQNRSSIYYVSFRSQKSVKLLRLIDEIFSNDIGDFFLTNKSLFPY